MPRKVVDLVPDDETIERLVPIKGWVYNLMVARGEAQKRHAKYQISYELERLAQRMKEQGVKDDEPGNNPLLDVDAVKLAYAQ